MNKLMMKLTIGSEAIFFISLIVAYLFFWKSGNFQKQSAEHLNIRSSALFTGLLVMSSFTFWKAEKNHSLGRQTAVKAWLIATILLGSVFLTGQGHEYYVLIKKDITISQSEFGSSFYTLTGFHVLHVLIGLLIMFIVLILLFSGYLQKPSSSVIRTAGIYWHFVDVVWIAVFTTIYVLPYLI